MAGKRKKGMTAAELLAQLSRDPEYQRRQQAADQQRETRTRELREAEAPIVRDLHAVGVEVDSVWDLVNTSEPYPDALPVLLRHLVEGTYPDRVLESLARALAVGPSVTAWDTLRDLYVASSSPGAQEGLAVTLAAAASDVQLGDLTDLLDVERLGQSRIHLLRAIKRVGGQRGRETLEALRSDPTFGKESTALLSS